MKKSPKLMMDLQNKKKHTKKQLSSKVRNNCTKKTLRVQTETQDPQGNSLHLTSVLKIPHNNIFFTNMITYM